MPSATCCGAGPRRARASAVSRAGDVRAAAGSADAAPGYAPSGLPGTGALLAAGGDARIALAPDSGANQYGCRPFPAPDLLAFGSATASIVSPAAFIAADALRRRLSAREGVAPRALTYAQELDRIRRELLSLCGLSPLRGLEVIFGASGTDIHLIAAQLTGGTQAQPTLVVMVDAAETGSAVPQALAGRHFSARAALGHGVSAGRPLGAGGATEVVNLPLRLADGSPREAEALDAEVDALVSAATAQGRRVLLTLVDVSKTGLIAPSPACLVALRRRLGQAFDVLVDACQFRLAPETLRAYLELDCMVALTGSKFVTGPTFSGALLVPPSVAEKFRKRLLPRALSAYSARADWPRQWPAGKVLDNVANYGLLLRWEAALAELRRFRAVPETDVAAFLEDFSRAVQARLRDDPAFRSLPVPPLDRRPLTAMSSWDQVQTLFPFLLCRTDGRPITAEATARIHRQLQTEGCHLGQPVACGRHDGRAVSALRLCASARLAAEATAQGGTRAGAVIARAMGVLDRAARLVRGGFE